MMTVRLLSGSDGAAAPVTAADPATMEVGDAVAGVVKLGAEVLVEAGTQVVIVTGLYPVVILV
jgi:hypothetical protein